MRISWKTISLALCAVSGFTVSSAYAQLAECEQLGVDSSEVPGSCIDKTLFEQIGTGQGDEHSEGSSSYLIKRDPAQV